MSLKITAAFNIPIMHAHGMILAGQQIEFKSSDEFLRVFERYFNNVVLISMTGIPYLGGFDADTVLRLFHNLPKPALSLTTLNLQVTYPPGTDLQLELEAYEGRPDLVLSTAIPSVSFRPERFPKLIDLRLSGMFLWTTCELLPQLRHLELRCYPSSTASFVDRVHLAGMLSKCVNLQGLVLYRYLFAFKRSEGAPIPEHLINLLPNVQKLYLNEFEVHLDFFNKHIKPRLANPTKVVTLLIPVRTN